MNLVPITKVTSSQLAADQLLTLIRSGAWVPGDQLPPERELSEKLHVGRSTVREALQILATLNIVQIVPGQGSFVKSPRGDEIFRPDLVAFLIRDSSLLDLIEAREMIETQTIRLACLRATGEDLAAVAAMLGEHEKALEDGRPIAEFARVFHTMLADASKSGVAAAFIHSILNLLQSRRQPARPHAEDVRELTEHRELLRLVQARDADAAAEYLVRHIVASAVSDVPPAPTPATTTPRRSAIEAPEPSSQG